MQVNTGRIEVTKFSIKAVNDVNAAATYQTINLQLPGHGGFLLHIMGKVKTAFVGVTNPCVSIGQVDDTNRIMPSQPISNIGNLLSGSVAGAVGARYFCTRQDTPGEPNPLTVRFTSDSGNLSSLTEGEVEFWAIYAI